MQVLFQARPDILESRGGDAIQLRATRDYLVKRGVQVDFDASPTCDCSRYDVVHLFNLTRPYMTALQLANAKRQGKPVCLSTIYWNMDDLSRNGARRSSLWRTPLRIGARWIRWTRGLASAHARHRYREGRLMASLEAMKACQEQIVAGVDMLLPNSKTELECLRRDFPVAGQKAAVVVHNCIDREVFGDPHSASRDWGLQYGLKEFVLCVGRVEPRKNQARLVRAMSGSDIPVVLVGSPGVSRSHIAQVRQNMKPGDVMLNEVGQEELCRIYAAARVHALPSLYETPGLASLEAGAMGCNLAMSDIGSQREYFGSHVVYCSPQSEDEIRLAIEQAWARPWPNWDLSAFIRGHYVWEVAAAETIQAYQQVTGRALDGNPRGGS